MNVQDNRRVYDGKDLPCGYQLVSVSQYATWWEEKQMHVQCNVQSTWSTKYR